MLSETDEGRGLIKVFWKDVRKGVKKVAPDFTKIIDQLSPGQDMPLFKAYYPYGATIADASNFFLPKPAGGLYKTDDKDAPLEVYKHLSYARHSIPLGMVLDRSVEYFIDKENERLSVPWAVCSPGSIFPITLIPRNQGRLGVYTLGGGY